MQHVDNIIYYLAFGSGFATGTYVGIMIEEKIAIGRVIIRIITRKDTTALVKHMRSIGYGVTIFDGQGVTGQVKLIYATIERKDLGNILEIIKNFDKKAFFSIEEVHLVKEGTFPKNHHWRF